jgi:hypothetical protein
MTEQPEALTSIPENLNYLSPLSFKFIMKRSPHMNYFLHRINVPGINLVTVEQPTPFVPIHHSGDHVEYNPLVATFRVDENLQNYFEIHNWIKNLGKTEEFEQYAALKANPDYTGLGLKSEITLTILDSKRNPNYTFTFHGSLPVGLSDLTFDAAANDIQYLVATAQFVYTYYTWEEVI